MMRAQTAPRVEMSMARSRMLWAVGLVCGCLWTPAALAQTQGAPTIGDVQRSVTPLEVPVPRPADAEAVRVTKPQPATPTSTVPIEVRSIRITGATVFPDESLQALVADVVGKTVTLAQLQAAAQRITDRYEEAGYPVARAVLPAQDIVDGVVEVLVLEGRVGRVTVDNRSLISDTTTRRLVGELPAVSVVHEPTLERRLLLLGETPGASRATVALQPGAATGETDLNIQVEPGPRVSGQIDLDNHGNRYTGYYRASSLINVNSPLGLGDQLQVRGLVSDDGLSNVRLAYRAPVGGSGLVAGAAWSMLRYELGREYAPLEANGWSRVGTAFVSYPIKRSVDLNLLGTLAYDDKSFVDRIDVIGERTHKRAGVTSFTVNGYGNAGPVAYALATVLSHGRLRIDTPAARLLDDSNGRTQGSYSKLVATGNALWPFTTNWGLYTSFYGQTASKNLDSSEKLSLGGAAGVRAYPQGESPGDEGFIASAELRYTIPLRPIQFAAFLDHGSIRFNRRAYLAADNNRSLRGTGLSVTWAPRSDMGLKLMVASRLGDEPVLSEPADAHTRVWLQGLWRF